MRLHYNAGQQRARRNGQSKRTLICNCYILFHMFREFSIVYVAAKAISLDHWANTHTTILLHSPDLQLPLILNFSGNWRRCCTNYNSVCAYTLQFLSRTGRKGSGNCANCEVKVTLESTLCECEEFSQKKRIATANITEDELMAVRCF